MDANPPGSAASALPLPATPVPVPAPAQFPALPHFQVQLEAPDLARWLGGNTGVHGFITRDSFLPGPHVGLVALTHGNELAGAIALERLLRNDLRPLRGRLTFGFANLAAFERFDPRQPTLSRFVDEDMNRIWDAEVLDSARQSSELVRARQMRPIIDSLDVLLDLHSMLWPSGPLLLSGEAEKGRRLAVQIGVPDLVVADQGHVSGRRLIDYRRFADPDSAATANLVEAGQHWKPCTVELTLAAIAGLLRHLDLVDTHPDLPAPPGGAPPRVAQVSLAVTANTAGFSFVQPFHGGDVIARADTLIATDGPIEIRTPHDDCLLVMPSLRPSRGHTAVRLARFL